MAGRDGAMTLYHFSARINRYSSSMDAMPTIQKLVKHKDLRIARKMFVSFFPNFENLRHAVAHHGELRRDRRSTERNSFTGVYSGGKGGVVIEKGARNTTLVDVFKIAHSPPLTKIRC